MADAEQIPETSRPLKWFVSVPVWGNWHKEIFRKHVFPNHLKLGLEGCTYVVHTDNEPHELKFVQREFPGEVIFKQKQGEAYRGMNFAHTEAIRMADGNGILFLPPDCVVSTNTFQEIKQSGKKLVMCASLRTFGGLTGDEQPPEGPKELNSWAIENLHPNMRGWIWGHKKGTDVIPSNIYFREGENFWCHGAHLHPIAAVIDRKIGGGKSIDSYLAGAYRDPEIWIVSNSEIAMAEITPRDKFAGMEAETLSIHGCIKRLRGKLHEHNKKFMQQPIALRGKAGDSGIPIVTEILKGLKD